MFWEKKKKKYTVLIKGMGFGLTSGVITTLGLLVGLSTSTHSKIAVLGGILTIAIADALSDAFGMHVSEESQSTQTEKHVWQITGITFIFKLLVALTFILPVITFSLNTAVVVSIFWGLLLLSAFSFYTACQRKTAPLKIIAEHVFIGLLVVVVSYFVGILISKF